MRISLLFLFALAWVSACIGCGQQPAPLSAHRELAARLEAVTVAMVVEVDAEGNEVASGGRLATYCGGVWVSSHNFLTASHCVAHLGEPPERRVLAEEFGLPLPPWNPVGGAVKFGDLGDLPEYYWTGKVTRFDPSRDLALVRCDEPCPPHESARIGLAPVDAGDRVEIVGHPVFHTWSYAEGYVSAIRPAEPNGEGVPMPTLQVEAPLSHGNSGGGCFDTDGNLIGIASYVESLTNGMGFFTYRDAIRRFLAES